MSSTSGCGVADDSNAPNAFYMNGSNASITMPVSVVGGFSQSGNPTSPPLTTIPSPVQDPYANNAKASLAALNASQFNYPIDVSGGKTLNLPPNITYYVSSLKGNGTVNGTGVTLVFSSTFNFPNNPPAFNITAPTSGTFSGPTPGPCRRTPSRLP